MQELLTLSKPGFKTKMSLEHEPVPIEDTIPDSLLAPTGDSLDLPAHLGKSRLGSIDAFRGFAMFLLMAEALHLSHMARNFPESKIWKTLAYHQTHVEWIGCSLHDMIQPSFSFLVGVSLPFSLLSRRQNGQSKKKMTLHAIWRAFALVTLGIFLRSVGRKQTNFTFEDTLSQIGLGYCFLFLLGLKTRKVQWIALSAILISYWALFAAYPLPSTNFDYSAVGLDKNSSSFLTGFQALVPSGKTIRLQRRWLFHHKLYSNACNNDSGVNSRRDDDSTDTGLENRLAVRGNGHRIRCLGIWDW